MAVVPTKIKSQADSDVRIVLLQNHLEKGLQRLKTADDRQRHKHPHETWDQSYDKDAPVEVQKQFFYDIYDKRVEEVLATLNRNRDCLKWRDMETNPLSKACHKCPAIADAFLDVIEADVKYLGEVNFRDVRGCTAISHCCTHGHLDLVRRLLALGAEVSILDIQRWGPLTYAAANGHVPIFQFLLNNSDVDLHQIYEIYYNKYEGTPRDSRRQILHVLAISTANHDALAEMAEALLQKDISMIDVQTGRGRTALHEACSQSKTKLVRVLLKYGSKTSCRDSSKRTPLHLALNETSPWSGVLTQNSIDCIEMLLQSPDLNISSRDCYGITPLMRAAMVGDVRAVKLMVEAGLDVSAWEPKGRRMAVHYAARGQHVETLDYLLSLNSSLVHVLQWTDYATPLLTLLSQCNQCYDDHMNTGAIFDCVCATLRRGANVKVRNAFDKSAADLTLPWRLWRSTRILVLAGDDFDRKKFEDAVNDTVDFLQSQGQNLHQTEAEFEYGSERVLASLFDLELDDENDLQPPLSPDNRAPDSVTHRNTLDDLDSFLWCQSFFYEQPLTLMQLARINIRRRIGDRLSLLCREPKIMGIPSCVVKYILLLDEIG